LGAAMRVAYLLTAGQAGVLPRTPMQVKRGKLILKMPGSYRELASERLAGRLRQLARLIGREPIIEA
jgi:exopolyphosphatase/guanosine-5'-triphosphate,3'-diphosphate pyrophosphatase